MLDNYIQEGVPEVKITPVDESTPFKQVYPINWIKIKDLIKSDATFNRKALAIETLFLFIEKYNYRTGEIELDAKELQDYLSCSKTAAYCVLKWFRDNDILIPDPKVKKLHSINYRTYILAPHLVKLLNPNKSQNKGDKFKKLKAAKRGKKVSPESALAAARRGEAKGIRIDYARLWSDPAYKADIIDRFPPDIEKADAPTSAQQTEPRNSSLFPQSIGSALNTQPHATL